MKRTGIAFILLLLLISNINAQKAPLDNSVYDGWKSLGAQNISEDGKWVTFTINPQQGDGWLYIYNVSTGKKDSVARGSKAVFSPDRKYIAYSIIPAYADTRQAKKKKLKDDKLPKNELEIRILSTGVTTKYQRIKSFDLPVKNSYWMAYLKEKKADEKKNGKTNPDSLKANETNNVKKPKLSEAKGSEFVIFNPVTGKEYKFQDVTEYSVATDGKTISFIQGIPDTTKVENIKISVFETQKELTRQIFEGKGSAKKLTSDKPGNQISFIYSTDTAKVKIYNLWLSKNSENAVKIIDSSSQNMIRNWSVSENGNFSFSDDGTRLFFGTAKKPVKEPVDTLLDEEKYKLDIWSWDDNLLQPMQRKQLEQEKKRSYQAVYHIDRSVMFQLADSLLPSVRTNQKGNSLFAIGSSELKYQKESSWEGSSSADYYLINVETGTKTLVFEKCSSRVYLSPSCKFIVFWDITDKGWYSMPIAGGQKKNISALIKVPLFDELNDVPDDPSPHGIAGWSDDEKHLLVYDRYDIWQIDLNGVETPVNITNGYGRQNKLMLRYIKLDPEEEFITSRNNIYLSTFNYENKEDGFSTLKMGKPADPKNLIMERASFPSDLLKAKSAEALIFRKVQIWFIRSCL